MKAMVLYEHGGMEKIKFEPAYPDPVAGEGDVLVRVRATSLNYHDIFTRRGMPGIRISLPVIMGLDIAGEIVGIGPKVEGWSVGDRVLVDPVNRVEGGLMGEMRNGGLAELCCVRAHQLLRIPENVTFSEAASLPTAYGTAVRMMITNGQVKAGEKVLILGASGGVGVCCVMLAKMAGAEVIACVGTDEKAQRLRELGADHVINYVTNDFVKVVHEKFGKPRVWGAAAGGVDVAVNYTGGDTWSKSLRCLKKGGRQLTCGATVGFDVAEDLRYVWSFELGIKGSNGWARSELVSLLDMVSDRKLKVVIDHEFPLEETHAAFELIERRQVFGKVVVTP